MNFNTIGYVSDIHGFSGPFSWWRANDSRFWYVCSHTQFGSDGFAVQDDFGNLVRVPA